MLLTHVFEKLTIKSDFLEKVTEHFSNSNFFSEERIKIILQGIQRYQEKDYLSSIHILVFQVEGLLREFIGLIGLPTFSFRNNEMRERMLPDIIETLGQVQGFNTDLLKFINIFLNDIRGDNLRNDIAHGLVQLHTFNKSNSELLIYLLLMLANYRIEREPQE